MRAGRSLARGLLPILLGGALAGANTRTTAECFCARDGFADAAHAYSWQEQGENRRCHQQPSAASRDHAGW
jgi:hypothetical protein